MANGTRSLPRLSLALLLVPVVLSGCVVTKPVEVVADVTVGAVRTAGAVVGTAVDVVTRNVGD